MSLLDEISAEVKRIPSSVQDMLHERAVQIRAELQQGLEKPYKDVLDLSYGDSHSTGLKPITFVRQVLAACLYPPLLHEDSLPADVRQRAQTLLGECAGGSIGSYPETFGIRKIQHSISDFISRRDGAVSEPVNIYITKGSTQALMTLLKLFVPNGSSLPTGVLTPVPSYHGFTMAMVAQGALMVPYYLCEEQGWAVRTDELRQALHAARRHCNPMVLYVINPGNPTGHVQSKESIKEVIRFAAEERLFIVADEVYQSCVEETEFYSYKRVLVESPPYSSMVELASINSISKGAMGECGLRCGYVELVNLGPMMDQYIFKLFCTTDAPIMGQIALDVMVDPPQPGQPSYSLYANEVQSIKRAHKNNVQRTLEVFSSLPGLTWQPARGGMYAFPRLHLSQSAIKHAQEGGLEPDTLYCLRLLEEEGLCILPGCDLGTKDGMYHIRISLAAQEETMKEALRRLRRFHLRFVQEFPPESEHARPTTPDHRPEPLNTHTLELLT